MSGLKPHLPLDRECEQLLIQIADPHRSDPLPDFIPESDQLARLLAAAQNHGVLPAAIRNLSEILRRPNNSAPEADSLKLDAVRKTLEAARSTLVHQMGFQMMLSHHAQRVMKAFAEAEIRGAIVKGAAFAQRLYPEAALRTFTDVDILIHVADRHKVRDVMPALGFELFEFEDRIGKDYHEQKWLLSTQKEVMVEVHSNLVHSPKLRGNMSIVYDDVIAAGGGDGGNATALLFVAATHGAIGHQLDRLQHLVDVMQAVRGAAGSVDVDRLAEVCDRCVVKLAVAGALELAGKTFGETRCLELARLLLPSTFARLPAQLLSPQLVVRGQSVARGRDSWRRKLFRQALKVA